MRVWLIVGVGVLVLAAVLVARCESSPAMVRAARPQTEIPTTPQGTLCPVLADLPYYGGARATAMPPADPALPPTPPADRYIPPRSPAQDPCALRLLPAPAPGRNTAPSP